MIQPAYQLSKLSCSYSHKDEERVLYVEDLVIPRGNVVFLLGASGSGKSTLLETHGLMNDTFADGSVQFFPPDANTSIRLEDLWYQNDAAQLAEIRRKYYSFIFQNTNLMEHFTAYENISLASMIQSEAPIGDSIERAKELMDRVNIPQSQVGLDTLSMHLSGGQRQRVTFVRALLSEHAVLFCDEPTGNLDERNAHELMRLIRESMTEDKTVIVVSHDIQLAMNFADIIVCISKEEGDKSSTIIPRNVYRRRDWEALEGDAREQFKRKVLAAYDKVTDLYRKSSGKVASGSFTDTLRYGALFRKKEGKVLNGKHLRNWWVVTGLLVFTFVALGFANGALNYLETKLKDPFVMWMTMAVPSSRTGIGSGVGDVIDDLNRDEVRREYNIRNVQAYSERVFHFRSETMERPRSCRARTVTSVDNILKDVLSPDNLIYGSDSMGYEDMGVICSQKLLRDLGLADSVGFLPMVKRIKSTLKDTTEDVVVPIPIRAIVKELPGKYDLLVSKYFHQVYTIVGAFDIYTKSRIQFFVHGDKKQAEQWADHVRLELANISIDSLELEVMTPEEHSFSWLKGYDVVVECYGAKRNLLPVYALGQQLMASDFRQQADLDVKLFYAFDNLNEAVKDHQLYDAISINLTSLSRVRDLRDYVFTQYNEGDTSSIIEIDITKVREKENFNFMSNMTRIISWLLIFFSALSIGLFLFNLLKMHLARVKPTLGTFKAFGLKDSAMRNIYLFVILRFVISAIVVSVAIAFGLGYLLDIVLHRFITIEEGVEYFCMIHFNTGLTLVVIVATTVSVAVLTIRNLLRQSPGDLIYGRG
jgi:ABC-type lipoprotein export system ATPase subunit